MREKFSTQTRETVTGGSLMCTVYTLQIGKFSVILGAALLYGVLSGGSAAAETLPGFTLNGEQWTYHDGNFKVNGYLVKPDGNGPFGAILVSHGKGGNAEVFALKKAREFAKWGLVTIAPEYTHSSREAGGKQGGGGTGGSQKGGQSQGKGKSTGDAAAATRAANGMGKSVGYGGAGGVGASTENIRRAHTCIEILRSLPYIDSKRIAAFGHSMGGFATIAFAASEPETLRAAAITGSGVSAQSGIAYPTAEAAGNIRTPFLIMHGTADSTVPPSASELFKEVLDKNHVPNERHLFEGEKHPLDQSNPEKLYALLRQWLTRHGVI